MTITSPAIGVSLCVASTVLLIVSASAMRSVRGRSAFRWSYLGTRLFSVILLVMTGLLISRVKDLLLGFEIHLPYVFLPAAKVSDSVRDYFPYLIFLGLAAVAVEMIFVEKCLRTEEDEQIEFAGLCSFLLTIGFVPILLVCQFGAAIALIKLAGAL